ncbi:ABC transporter ATP-binding protein [Agrobacterium tumefaciens]|uniref:ABC transporter ATP-binding protein n=1 Tax=Agrobacterium tumefaciens TaxID=358 RepID=UPI00054D940E|nr:sn-glycerol-3-phosphate ABC transporter ATP-binding protein UgpC [Agrobacterium tumefaciens]
MDNVNPVSVAVNDLTIQYNSLKVIDGLNLSIQRGEFLVLLGPSGCGKSTLLNSIAGLMEIADGEIWISGRNVTWAQPKDRGIAMVFQSYALYPHMTVAENLSFGLKVSGLPKDEIKERVAEAARLLQIESLMKRKPSELSGGQRQRVAIGRALVRKVDVFLFDEPLSNLDAKLRNELRVELKKLHLALGNTMIYVTHDQVEAMTLADRIAVMKGGIIQQLGSPEEIYQYPSNQFVAGFIGSPIMNFIEGEIRQVEGVSRFYSDGLTIDLANYRFSQGHVAGPAILGVRSENIRLASSSSEEVQRGTIDFIETLGADTVIWVQTGPSRFAIRMPGTSKFERNSNVEFIIDAAHVSLFDTKTTMRL